jgi:hypothetical protein
MDAGKKSKKSPQQAEQNDNDEACSHTHASDYSIWNISDCGLAAVLFWHAPDGACQVKLFFLCKNFQFNTHRIRADGHNSHKTGFGG